MSPAPVREVHGPSAPILGARRVLGASFAIHALTASVPLDLGSADAPVWALCLWMVVLGTILPFALSLGALHHLPATRVATVSMLEVLLAALVAWAWLGEALSAAQLVGGAVVLVGVVLAQTSR